MIDTYREDRPWLLLTLPLWSFLPWIGATLGEVRISPVDQGVAGGILAWAAQHPAWAVPLLGTLFTMIIGLQSVTLSNEAELAARRGMLPIVLFPLLLAFGGPHRILGPELLGMPLVIMAIRRLWRSSAQREALAGLFDTGLLIGMASLLHPPYLLLLVVVWATNAVFRPFGWRDHLIPLLGAAIVRWMEWGITRATGTAIATTMPRPTIVAAHPAIDHSAHSFLFWLLVTILLVMALAGFISGYRRSVMHGKNIRSALLAFALCCTLLAAFGQLSGTGTGAVLYATPGAALLCAPFSSARRVWLANLVWYSLLALALWSQTGLGLSSPP